MTFAPRLLPGRPAVIAGMLAAVAALGGRVVRGADEPSEFVSRRWLTDDGLPHNVVTRVQQDPVGYLWFATLAGLTRFDGRYFKVYPVGTGTPTGGRNVRDLAILPDGTVLFLPASGGVWQVRGDRVTEHPASALLAGELLLGLYIESRDVLWFETSRDIVRWEKGRLERFGPDQGLGHRALRYSWAADGEQRTWIAGPGFLGYYRDGKIVPVNTVSTVVYRVAPSHTGGVWVFGSQLYKFEHEQLLPLADTPWPAGRASVRAMFEDRAGTLWVASSREGTFRFDGRRFQPLPDLDGAVECVNEDREGNLWLATDSGIRRLRAKAFTEIDAQVNNVAEDDGGSMWFAGQDRGAIRRTGNIQEVYPFHFGRNPLRVSTVAADHAGHLWLGTPIGVFETSIADPKSVRRIDAGLRTVRIMAATRGGDVWALTASQAGYFRGEHYVRLSAVLPPNHEWSSLAEDPAGAVWLGTSHGQLYRFADDTLSLVATEPAIGDAAIHAILPDGPDRRWLATTEGLLLVADGRVRRFTQADGLPDDIVLQLVAGAGPNLWLATPRGLFRVSREELLAITRGEATRVNAVTYGPEQGLFGIAPTTNYQPAAWRDQAGNLWFCTFKGVIGLHPAQLPYDASPPPVLVDDVRINGRHTPWTPELRVPPGRSPVEIRFAALSFAAPERVQLRHQLEGIDGGWVDTPPDRTARYTQLPPGRYQLRVIACNSEGVWNAEGVALAITVLPSWWQTAWFRLGAVFGFAGLVGWGARYWSQRKLKAQLERLEREHALEKERARIARDMHDELGGSVTGINLIVQRLRDAPPEPTRLLDVLDRRVRRLTLELERVVWTVSPKHTSLDQLATFIERFAHNLFTGSTITCRVHGRESIPDRPLTPECQHHVLAITKEAINNVLKHSRATEATVALAFVDDVFSVTVTDNGAGFSPEAQAHSERNGLKNMRARVAEVGGSVSIDSAPGRGTSVCVRIPVPPS